MSIHFSAPEGQRIRVDTPTGWDTQDLEFSFRGGRSSSVPGSHDDVSPAHAFDNLIGGPLSLTHSSLTLSGPAGDRLVGHANFSLIAGEFYTFEELAFETTVPGGATAEASLA